MTKQGQLLSMTPLELHDSAVSLIRDPDRWLQKASHLVKDDVDCFCWSGALHHVGDAHPNALFEVFRVSESVVPWSIQSFNDSRTHEAVMGACDKVRTILVRLEKEKTNFRGIKYFL